VGLRVVRCGVCGLVCFKLFWDLPDGFLLLKQGCSYKHSVGTDL
jgi:hypothetical protein